LESSYFRKKYPNYRKSIEQLLDDSKLKENAESFAGKYADFDVNKRNEAIVKRCEQLLAGD